MATTDTFKSLWRLGYTRLVPVTPPGVDLHPQSSMAKRLAADGSNDPRGKAPGVKGQDGLWRGMNFVAHEARESDLAAWGDMDASVGVKTGDGLVAVDIDTLHPPAAARLREMAEQMLGPAPVRIGRAPKSLLLYAAPPGVPYQRVSFSTPADEKPAVEILTEGRQFVAAGTHPATGKPYAWPGGVPERGSLTAVTREQIDAYLAAVAKEMPSAHRTSAGAGEAPEQDALRAPSWAALSAAVEALPNTSSMFPDREDYVRVAYAIKASAPPGHEDAARDLFLDWCGRWEDGDNDMTEAVEDWRRAKPPFKVGFSFLQAHAPGLYFAPVSAEEAERLVAVSSVDDMFRENDAATNPASRFAFLDLDELAALPDPRWQLERHLPETGFGILYGAPGAGKSFIALDMALHIAHALPDWHGDEIAPPDEDPRSGVLYIAGEGASGYKLRVAAWKQGRLLPDRKADMAFMFSPCNFMDRAQTEGLVAAATAYHPSPLRLIVIDTVSRAIPGADENLQKDVSLFVEACERLGKATGAFVLGVHHTAKTGDLRGSSVFRGQPDVIMQFKREKGMIGYLQCEKQKDGPDGWSDAYRLAEVSILNAQDKPLSSLVPHRMKPQEVAEATRAPAEAVDRMLAEIRAAWEDGKPLTMEQRAPRRFAPKVLAAATGLTPDEIDTTLQALIATRRIEARVRAQDVTGLYVMATVYD